MWFQQDDATCHTARVTMDLLRSGSMNLLFQVRDRSMGRLNRANQRLYPASVDELEDNFRQIPFAMLQRVSQNWTKRIHHFKRSRGQHLH